MVPCHCVNTNSCHLVCTRFPHSCTVLLTREPCSASVEPASTTLSTLHWRSIVQDLTIQRQALLPSCSSHSSFSRVATLGSSHGMIPTWQRSRSRSVCLRSLEPASAAMLLLQFAPATINYAQSLLSRERMRLAETNRIRLQIEQLRYHCASINSLNDTCDVR